MSRHTRTAQPHTARVGRVRGRVTHHHDVLPGDVDFEVGGDPRPAAGLGAVAVRLGAHEVHGERRVDAADQVGEEEERPRGDADDDGGLAQGAEVGGELGGHLRHPGGDLGLRPQHRSMPASARRRRPPSRRRGELGLGFRGGGGGGGARDWGIYWWRAETEEEERRFSANGKGRWRGQRGGMVGFPNSAFAPNTITMEAADFCRCNLFFFKTSDILALITAVWLEEVYRRD